VAERNRITIPTLYEKKAKGEKIVMLTAYDHPFAMYEDRAGVDIILVGDSLGMTVLGMESTLPVTMDIMIAHAKAVRKGAPNAHVIGDMPYMTFQISKEEAIRNAGMFMSECGVDSVKLEGGRNMAATVRAIVDATIPVMGHIGLTPQSISQLGGFRAQGRTVDSALALIEDAKLLEEAGAFAILVEAVPPPVAKIITERSSVPIISLGSGPDCDGSCLIVHDMVGFFERFVPKFVKKYADVASVLSKAFEEYVEDVRSGKYPAPEHCYSIKQEEMNKLMEALKRG